MNSTSATITSIALLLFLIFIGPVFTIMALNTVFGMGIPLTIWTWLSVFWLCLVIRNTTSNSKEKE